VYAVDRGSFGGRGSAGVAGPLHGRDAELEAIGRVVDDARELRGAGVLALIGDPGLGTSALLEHAAARAHDMRVLRCVGASAEVEFPFAGLLQLVQPLLGLVDRLPAPQAAALRGVFGLSDDRVEDRFLISIGALTLLGEAAEDLPLLCLVDEVAWLDHETAETLAFVARRLEAEPIAILIALTEAQAQSFALPNVLGVRLSPLETHDALAVVRDIAGPNVSPSVAERIVRAAGGVPLVLTELVASLTQDQLAGRTPLPVALPVSAGIEELYRGLVRALPGPSRTALLIAAATRLGELKTIAAALRAMGLDEEGLDEAARAGLVEVSDRVSFRHPAVRLAVYGSASPTDRRRVHEALASVLVGPEDEDLRVWHRALAKLGPDDDVAAELERSADRAASRSGCAAAASALERAAALSTHETERARRLARAAELAWLGGQSDRALAFAAEAESLDPDPVNRSKIDFVRAAWEAQHGVTGDAIPLMLRAASAVEETDPATALRGQLGGVLVMSLVGRRPSPADLDRLERLAARAPQTDGKMLPVVAVNEWVSSGARTAPPIGSDDASSIVEAVTDPVLAPFAIPTAAYLGDVGAARINGELVVRRARARGALAMLSFALRELAAVEFSAHRFDDARIHASEGLQLGLETGNTNVTFVHRGIVAAVAAVHGDEPTCRAEAEEALLGAIERRNVDAVAWANLALGHLELSLGHPDAAERFDTVWAHPLPEVHLIGAADAVEAAVRAGRHETAELRLEEFERWTSQTGAPWARPLVARSRASLASGEEAERHFEQALRLHEDGGSPFDRARTELLFGELLRRDRRRAEARPHLREAAETFASIRASVWEERARNELRATGEVLRRRDPEAIWQLTPQEMQIARIVARGASNRDAAAELFLSPRTVEYHLRKVFTKLGVSSRGELARMQLEG
jgi:DNA-binding CsgD family transcriptional regulator